MANLQGLVNALGDKLSLTRRGFVKGTLALGAAASLYGCSKGGEGETVYTEGGSSGGVGPDGAPITRFYGSSGHNCGGRCISRAEVSKGRIIRILTDESMYTSDGTYIDPESVNFPQTRSCARCRAYKYRLYHPGRLRYPLKQTKKRGDLSGFVRITWAQALKEIATKHKAVYDKYGVDGIYQIYACGSVSSNWNGSQSGPIGKGNGYALKLMGGVTTPMFGSYSTHQNTYFGLNYVGADGHNKGTTNEIANYAGNVVLWGDNSMSTGNPSSYGTIRSVEEMKKRKSDAKVYFIGPHYSDTGVTIADEWLVSKPFTDPALVAGMIYHMLDNTFDLATGELKTNPWLDINYLDTMVYGFFDSPKYTMAADGTIQNASSSVVDNIAAVDAGRSYASWILGNNDKAKKYSELGANSNYTAAQFSGTGGATIQDSKRWAPCSYAVAQGPNTVYKTKQDFKAPKTPAWASAITGIPEEAIKRLASVFCHGGPITSRWSGGMQKQADGIANLFAIQALHVITKNVGTKGAGYFWSVFTGAKVDNDETINVAYSATSPANVPLKPAASCTAWHTAIKMAYMDELQTNGYTAKYIPNWDITNFVTGDGNVYWDDAGTKAMIAWDRETNGTIKTESNGTCKPVLGSDDRPLIAGIRLMYNAGGNIFMNQHENSNDSRDMLERLNANDPTNADSFCLVSIDNFLSPTPRYSDYVLPGSTFWEQQDIVAPTNSAPFYTPQVIPPPGEAKPVWDIAANLIKTYEAVAGQSDLYNKFIVDVISTSPTIEGHMKQRYKSVAATSPHAGMKWADIVTNPILPSKPDNYTVEKPLREGIMNKYRNMTPEALKLKFINPNGAENTDYVNTNGMDKGGYGNDFLTTTTATMVPITPKRFQVYSPILVLQYEHRFEKYHGYLPEGKRGQKNIDIEGDPKVLGIPVYYAYQDYFMEAYGGIDKISDLEFCLTTTHDRYRSHSSMAENPMLRELTHRVPGRDAKGNAKPANDYNNYAIPSERDLLVGQKDITLSPLNRTIENDGSVKPENKDIASYSEIWMNEKDASDRGILDGDLLQVENPIGAVRVVARLTKRCARGFVDLHQGCWYDPREIDGKIVDVGGNCNTLMASQPSRIDHGNGQQSAMVKITKVNY